MSLPQVRHTVLPTNGDSLRSQGLADILAISAPPEDLQDSPPVFSFSRNREVEMPWRKILQGVETGTTSISAIRSYFESSWGINPKQLDEDQLDALTSGNTPMIESIPVPDDTPDPSPDTDDPAPQVFRSGFQDVTPVAEPVTTGIIFVHRTSRRMYLVHEMPGDPLTLDDFDHEHYEATWATKVSGVEIVFALKEEAETFYTDYDELDLRPSIIERRYAELAIQQKFAEDISTESSTATTRLISTALAGNITRATLDEIDELQRNSLRLQMRKFDVEGQLKRLKRQAADLGFVLFLKDDPPPPDSPAGKDHTGVLFTTFQKTVKWTTVESRPIVPKDTPSFGGLIGAAILSLARLIQVPVTKQHSKVVTAYKPADTHADLLGREVHRLRGEGKQVFVVDRNDNGFVTPDGQPLRSIMERCSTDEAFRRTCVVILPVFEETITGRQTLTKYSIFKHPLPGITPTALPRLSIRESLSYRAVWTGCELGELVSSVNLAPGEQRKVTVSREYKQETTVSKSSTSIFDITSSESSDLASEMESEARQESEKSSSMDASVKAGGGFGGFTAEASASAGKKESLKSFSQSMNKVAKSAAQSVNQQNRQEVSTTSSSSTSVTNTDISEATIQNINVGRTLNLFFYRLYNRLKGGLYLEELDFSVLSGVEVISGSGIYESTSYGRQDVAALLNEFQRTHLPFDINPDDEDRYTIAVLDAFRDLIEHDYAAQVAESDGKKTKRKTNAKSLDDGTEPQTSLTSPSVGLVSFALPKPKALLKAATGDANDGQSPTQRQIEETSEWLANSNISQTPMEPTNLKVLSKGLYLDSSVGVVPSTEPYSEDMRQEEVRMRRAEVDGKLADSEYKLAQARRLDRLGRGGSSNVIIGGGADGRFQSLSFHLKLPLAPGQWGIHFDGEAVIDGEIPTSEIEKYEFVHAWSETQDWLKSEDLLSRIALIETESGDEIRLA